MLAASPSLPELSKREANEIGLDLDLRDPKSSKRLKTPAATPMNEPEQAYSKALLAFKKMCATSALDYYNIKNDTKFELVSDETLDSYSFRDLFGSWIHCCFHAKEDSSFNVFFAELQYVYPSGPALTTCKILEGETKFGCENCLSVTHPVVGYRGDVLKISTRASPVMSDQQCKYKIPDYPTFRPSLRFDPISWSKKRRETGFKGVANRALDNFNKINGTKFVLGDDEKICCFAFSGNCIHCCFSAAEDSPNKLFFAEIKYYRSSEPVVTICKIVEGETKLGCKNCKSIIHPVDWCWGSLPAAPANTESVVKNGDEYYLVYVDEYVAVSMSMTA